MFALAKLHFKIQCLHFPLKRILFTLHHDLQKKEPKLQKGTMMSMKVHVPSLHAPIYRNLCLCALENKINSNILMSSDPCKSVRQRVFPCTTAETIWRTNQLSSQAPYEKKNIEGLSLRNTNHAHRVPTFKLSSDVLNIKKK